MADASQRHQEQINYWNSAGGERWASSQEQTDRMLAPVLDLLLQRAKAAPGMAVLDIGCGYGTTTLDLAKAVTPAGRVLGIDVSTALIDMAKARAAAYPQVEFLRADAAAHRFIPFADLAISRFGVMFFGDAVAAFANIRKALKPGGRIVFACWQALGENPWMHVPLQAVWSAGVPRAPRAGPEEPGPLSLSDPERVASVLTAAGFGGLTLSPATVPLDIAAGRGLAAAVRQAMTIGPAAAALREQPQSVRDGAACLIEEALGPHQSGDSVVLPGSIWIVEASAP